MSSALNGTALFCCVSRTWCFSKSTTRNTLVAETNLVHSGSHGHNWGPGHAVWLVGTIVFLLWNTFFWLCISVSEHWMAWTGYTMVMRFWLPFPSLLKLSRKQLHALDWLHLPWQVPEPLLLTHCSCGGPLLPAGLENRAEFLLPVRWYNRPKSYCSQIHLVLRVVLVFHQATLARRS